MTFLHLHDSELWWEPQESNLVLYWMKSYELLPIRVARLRRLTKVCYQLHQVPVFSRQAYGHRRKVSDDKHRSPTHAIACGVEHFITFWCAWILPGRHNPSKVIIIDLSPGEEGFLPTKKSNGYVARAVDHGHELFPPADAGGDWHACDALLRHRDGIIGCWICHDILDRLLRRATTVKPAASTEA